MAKDVLGEIPDVLGQGIGAPAEEGQGAGAVDEIDRAAGARPEGDVRG
ncbi:hypothetical protein BH18ACT6_BH18ACT6_17820 [soil metagenome]